MGQAPRKSVVVCRELKSFIHLALVAIAPLPIKTSRLSSIQKCTSAKNGYVCCKCRRFPLATTSSIAALSKRSVIMTNFTLNYFISAAA